MPQEAQEAARENGAPRLDLSLQDAVDDMIDDMNVQINLLCMALVRIERYEIDRNRRANRADDEGPVIALARAARASAVGYTAENLPPLPAAGPDV